MSTFGASLQLVGCAGLVWCATIGGWRAGVRFWSRR